MKHIVCAARGGPRSRPAIKQAIRLAKEHGALLTFLYILDYEFLGHATLSSTHAIHQQLREMGEFIMLTLQEQARQAGVVSDYAVEEGTVRQGICRFVESSGADFVVIGRPAQSDGAAVFDPDSLSEFANQLEAETGATVIFAQTERVDQGDE